MFLAVARGGTLAAAASALGIDASTAQRRMGKLERDLEARLFERSQRGYALTAAGGELLAHVLTMEQEVMALARRIGGRDESLEGVVRVATVDDLATAVLSPIVAEFRRRHPRVTLDVGIASSFADLTRREADVAIRFGAKPSTPDLVVRHLTRVDVALYASRRYVRAHGQPRSHEELAAHPIVCGDESMAAVPMERFMRRYADPAKVALRSNSMLARFAALRDGVGIGVLGCFMGEPEPSLQRLALDVPNVSSDLWMLVHVDLKRNARVRAFVDFAFEALLAQRSRFERPARSRPRAKAPSRRARPRS